jgi:hypothetical protein
MRIALVSLLFFILQGCSTIKLGYNKVDTLAYWWLDGYADFSSAQSEKLQPALEQFMRWHREQELPAYAALLQQAQGLAGGNITPAQVCSTWDAVQTRIDVLVSKALPALTEVALDMSPRQLSHLERQWAKKNANWQDDWLKGTPAQREQKRLDAMVDRYESFYGELNPAQTKLLQQQIKQSPWTPEWGWQDRLQKQQQLISVLRTFQTRTHTPEQAQEALKTVYQNWTSTSAGPGFEMRQRLMQQSCVSVAQLHNTTAPAQRVKAVQRIKAYLSDVKDLASP